MARTLTRRYEERAAEISAETIARRNKGKSHQTSGWRWGRQELPELRVKRGESQLKEGRSEAGEPPRRAKGEGPQRTKAVLPR